MIRGTTPTIVFKLPFDAVMLAEAWVTISQNEVAVIDKELKDLEVAGNALILKLTQDETLMLDHDVLVEMQVRARTVDGNALASRIMREVPERILKEGVI